MSLYDEAAVALIAEGAAGKDGVLYNIKPEQKLKATELVTNGGFIDGDGWEDSSPASGVITFSDGKAVFADLNNYHYLRTDAAVFEKDKTYKVSFTITDFTMVGTNNPQLLVQESENQSPTITSIKASGQYSFIYKAKGTSQAPVGSDSKLVFKNSGSNASNKVSFKLDNVSVKEVEQKPLDFTFNRGSNLTATRVAPSGYIEKGRENLVKYSNGFDNALWDGASNGVTVTSGQSGYDGSNNAFKLDKIADDFKRVQQAITETTGLVTWSVYAKAGTLSEVVLRGGSDDRDLATDGDPNTNPSQYGNNDRAEFNLANGTFTAINNSVTASMEPITGKSGDTNRWYRCSVVFKDPTRLVQIYAGFDDSVAGNIFVQNAQLEVGLVATDYIESGFYTGKAGILEDSPRFDYLDVTCPHLLMEPTRKNSIKHSEYFAGSYWTNKDMTMTTNHAVSPQGVKNATKIAPNSTNTTHHVSSTISFGTADEFLAGSVFVKPDGHTFFHMSFGASRLNAIYELSGDGTVREVNWSTTAPHAFYDDDDTDAKKGDPTATIQALDNGWYRCTLKGEVDTAGVDACYLRFSCQSTFASTHTFDGVGNGTDGVLIWGAQVEEDSAYVTSYIPNYGTTAGETRNDDVTNAVDFGDYMDGEDITWYVELAKNDQFIRDSATTGIRLSTTDLNASSVKFYRSYETGDGGLGIRTIIYFADDENDNDPASHQITEAGPVKVIVRRVKSTGEFTVFYDGAQKYQAFAPANYDKFKTLKIDGEAQSIFLNNMFLFDRALTDDECIALTT